MNQTLFTKTIIALRDQYDQDKKRAKELSSIYGADIDPVDNSKLSKMLILFLQDMFKPKDGHCEIEIFCYEHDFGRKLDGDNTGIDLWNRLVKDQKVIEPINVNFNQSRH